MSILIFVLSLILLIAAAASGYASVDLLPTSIGVLYAMGGAVAASAAVVTFALAVLSRRIDRLTKLAGQSDRRSLLFRPGFGVTPSVDTALAEAVTPTPLAIDADALEGLGEPGSEDERARSTSIAPATCRRLRRSKRSSRRRKSRRGRRASSAAIPRLGPITRSSQMARSRRKRAKEPSSSPR